MKIERKKREIASPNIIPMIDVVFFLVIFFMIYASFSSNEGIKVNLPSSVTAQPQIDDSFVVTIGAGGQLYFNEDEVNAAGVERRVREAYSKNPDILGIIQADKVVPYSAIIDVIDLVRKSGVQNVSLAASLELER